MHIKKGTSFASHFGCLVFPWTMTFAVPNLWTYFLMKSMTLTVAATFWIPGRRGEGDETLAASSSDSLSEDSTAAGSKSWRDGWKKVHNASITFDLIHCLLFRS